MKLNLPLIGVLALAAALAGCTETPLFSGKKAPDELAVIEGPPLFLPPSFDVRPPSDLAARPHEDTNTQGKAGEIITGQPVTATTAAQDDWLVKRAGGNGRDAGIRARLEAEEKAKTEVKKQEENKGFFSRIFSDDKEAEPEVDEAGRVILDPNAPDAGSYQKQ